MIRPSAARSAAPFLVLAAALALVAPLAAGAQQRPSERPSGPPATSPPTVSPGAPTAPPLALEALGGDRLARGAWTYVQSVTRRGATVELGRRTLTVSPVEEGGHPAWLLLDETRAHGQTFRDSLLVARGTLRPIRQYVEAGPMRVRLSFPGDSVAGAIELPGAPATPVALRAGPALVVNAAMLESVLTLAPLDSGWRASVGQLVLSPVGTAVLPVTLTVTGQESVTVPAGTFPAWIVEVTTAEVSQQLWVDRVSGRVVRARSLGAGMPDVVYETVLVRR